MTARSAARHSKLATIVLLAALAGSSGCRTMTAAEGDHSTTPARTAAATEPARSLRWRTELYFGLDRKGGSVVSEREFERFLNENVTPRFPDGYTELAGQGRYRQDGVTIVEPSRVIVLLHDGSAGANDRINAIAEEYDAAFGQDSVLRVDQAAVARFVERARNDPRAHP